jgi:tetratricopeptide (TPR) repeat protein
VEVPAYHIHVKRVVLAVVLVLASLAGLCGYTATRRETTYRLLIARGEEALAKKDTFAAITDFSSAIEFRDDAMLGYLKRGEAHFLRGQLEPALKDLKHATELDPSATRPQELLGDVYFAQGRFDRAAERYRDYVTLDDRSPRVLYKLALAHYRAAQPAAGAGALQQAIRLDERFAEAYYLLALCQKDLEEPADAIRSLQKAIALAPGMFRAREELAESYRQSGRNDRREAQLNELRKLDPGPAREVAYALAVADGGGPERAVKVLSQAIARHPEHAYAYVALGRLWLDNASAHDDRIALIKAEEALQQAVDMEETGEALTLYGRTLLLASNIPMAERMLQRATEKLPVDPLAFYYLADVAERIGHLDRARRALLDYHALIGDDGPERRQSNLYQRIADLSSRLDEPAVAAMWYQRAIDSASTDQSLLLRYAEAQRKAGNPAAARDAVAKVLEADPTNRAALALSRRLGQR